MLLPQFWCILFLLKNLNCHSYSKVCASAVLFNFRISIFLPIAIREGCPWRDFNPRPQKALFVWIPAASEAPFSSQITVAINSWELWSFHWEKLFAHLWLSILFPAHKFSLQENLPADLNVRFMSSMSSNIWSNRKLIFSEFLLFVFFLLYWQRFSSVFQYDHYFIFRTS
jgi:hypothetical protein